MKALFEKGKYPEIDGLRACAILLVVLTHIFQSMPGLSYVSHSIEWMTPLFNGWIGVDLFFVLSGFLIGGQILTQIQTGKFSASSFYFKRAFRILPAYFSVLLFLLLVQLVSEKAYLILTHVPFSEMGIIKSFLLLTDYFPHFPGIGSWSLSIEEQFYWIIPGILIFLSRSKNPLLTARFFLFIWGLALFFRMCLYRRYNLGPDVPFELVQKIIYYPFHTRMDGLAAGILTALSFRAGKAANPVVHMIARGTGLVFIGFVLLTGGLKGGWLETTLQYSLLSAGFGFFLWGLLAEESRTASITVRILRNPFWTPLARLSYSIYLTHLLTIHMMDYFFQKVGMAQSWLKPPAMLSMSALVSFGLFMCVENPLHQWAKTKFR